MSSSSFRFEADSHTYWKGDRRIPSVTQIIGANGLLPDYEFASTECGTAVHEATVWADAPERVKNEPGEEMKPYLHAWDRAKVEIGIKDWIAIERPMLCEEVGFGWTADRIAWRKGRICPAIIEIKTGKEEDGHYIQVGAYAYGFQLDTEFDVSIIDRNQVERFLVYLDDTGVPKIRRQGARRDDLVRDLTIFKSAVSLAAWRIERGLFWKAESKC